MWRDKKERNPVYIDKVRNPKRRMESSKTKQKIWFCVDEILKLALTCAAECWTDDGETQMGSGVYIGLQYREKSLSGRSGGCFLLLFFCWIVGLKISCVSQSVSPQCEKVKIKY